MKAFFPYFMSGMRAVRSSARRITAASIHIWPPRFTRLLKPTVLTEEKNTQKCIKCKNKNEVKYTSEEKVIKKNKEEAENEKVNESEAEQQRVTVLWVKMIGGDSRKEGRVAGREGKRKADRRTLAPHH